MQYAVYIDTPLPRSGGKVLRHYVQTNHPGFVDIYNPLDGYGKLDSHPILFDTEKSALAFTRAVCESCSDYTGVYTIGYHGLTENGNACRPFATVKRGDVNAITNVAHNYKHYSRMYEAYENFRLPRIATIAASSVIRGYSLTREQLLGELDHLLANMVDEELANAMDKINSLESQHYTCTDVDMYDNHAIVHYVNIDQERPRCVTLTITALNLYDEKAIKELGTMNERIRAEGMIA